MAAKSRKKLWFKFYSEEWLAGDWRLLEPFERSVYVDLLAQASSFYGEYKMYSALQTARRFAIPLKKFRCAVDRLVDLGKIGRRTEGKAEVLSIVNWDQHQAGYLKKSAEEDEEYDTDPSPRGEEKGGEVKEMVEQKGDGDSGSGGTSPRPCPSLALRDRSISSLEGTALPGRKVS